MKTDDVSGNYKKYVSEVTGLQVGLTDQWVVMENGAWRNLTASEYALIEAKLNEANLLKDKEAKLNEANGYLKDTDWVAPYIVLHKCGVELLSDDSNKLAIEVKREEFRAFIRENEGK